MRKGEGANTGIVALVVILVLVLLFFVAYAFNFWPFAGDIDINEGDTIIRDEQPAPPTQVNIRDEPDQTDVNVFPGDGDDGGSNDSDGNGQGNSPTY